jgi:membrane dipeptidase
MGAEGGHSIADSPAVLRMLARLGVRYMTLTHVTPTTWADAATAPAVHGGLTERGRAYVREMNALGMLVDLSHVSPDVMRQALEVAAAPVIFSHSSCAAVTDHPRNVPDDVLGSLAGNGGVAMIAFVAPFVSTAYAEWEAAGADGAGSIGAGSIGAGPPVGIGAVADHVEHAREVAGLDHIGIGGDYDGFPRFPARLEDVSCYPRLLAELADRGWGASELAALTGGNVLRVLEETDAAFAAQRGTGML